LKFGKNFGKKSYGLKFQKNLKNFKKKDNLQIRCPILYGPYRFRFIIGINIRKRHLKIGRGALSR